MSLTTALGIAQQSLLTTSRRTNVLTRNVADAQNPDYVRRYAALASTTPGSRVMSIQRATNDALFRANLSAISAYEGQAALTSGITTLTQAINGIDNASSSATALGNLYNALQLYAASPSNTSLAENNIDAARQVARALNDGTGAINARRVDADAQLTVAVRDLNQLLADFTVANDAVISGTKGGRDVSDALDSRDALLKRISEHLPISTITRANNDIVITTTSGTTLFETVPREVTFQGKPGYAPGSTGNPVYVDGVPLVGGTGGNTTAAGKIASLLQMRDTVAPAMQAQLDEIARGVIATFAEFDQTGGGNPPLAGLFTWSGGPAIPADGTISTGIAGSIVVNPLLDSEAGGNPLRLRDGGANGAAYLANTTGAGAFSDLLNAYTGKLDQPIAFDPAAGAGSSASVLAYSASAISWLENLRQQATNAAETKGALIARTSEALSMETGVNIDDQMALLLELEHSYEASARLIKAVDEMLAALLAAVG